MGDTQKPNPGWFRRGHRRSQASIEKQRQTLREQCRAGLRKPPRVEVWTKEMVASKNKRLAESFLVRNPIGSRRLHKSKQRNTGYWKIKVGSNDWRLEHRVIMERHLGRKLLRSESVHHINHDGLDNRIENLTLMGVGDHARMHSVENHRKNPQMSKGATLKPGVWSRKFENCVACGRTDRKYASLGFCVICMPRTKRRNLLTKHWKDIPDDCEVVL